MNIAILLRKSPTDKKEIDKSFIKQEDLIRKRIKQDFPGQDINIKVFKDIAKGDDDKARIQLYKFFEDINNYQYAYVLNVDRFSRSYLGLKYIYEYIIPSNCKIRFLEDINLYDVEENINQDNLFMFGIMCLVSQKELMNIRRRTQEGRARAKKNNKKLSQLNILEKQPELKTKVEDLKRKGLSYNSIANELELSKTMVFNILNKY